MSLLVISEKWKTVVLGCKSVCGTAVFMLCKKYLKIEKNIFKNLIAVFLIKFQCKIIAIVIVPFRYYNDIHSEISKNKGIHNSDTNSLIFDFKEARQIFTSFIAKRFSIAVWAGKRCLRNF